MENSILIILALAVVVPRFNHSPVGISPSALTINLMLAPTSSTLIFITMDLRPNFIKISLASDSETAQDSSNTTKKNPVTTCSHLSRLIRATSPTAQTTTRPKYLQT
ncbi:Uncharacterized protein HZ326_15018 [Fusarium oxysporum f. sp. albedinis]|nr:Uncharacterized protein HZ326_15018 [Fusarium oxysporum f. sp. albedinis]